MTTPEFTPEVQAYIDSKIAAGIEAATAPAPELTAAESDAAIDAIRENARNTTMQARVSNPPNAHQVAAWKTEYAKTRRGQLTQEEFDAAFKLRFGYDRTGAA